VDADTTLKLDKPELRVTPDRARAADLGVNPRDLGTALRLMVGGEDEVTRFRDPLANEDYDVELRLSEKDRNDPALIEKLYVATGSGGVVPLSNLATVEAGQTASRIDRLDRQRMVSMRAGVAPGYALADRLQALNDAVAQMDLPAGYSTRVSGRGRELEQTFNEFVWAFILSVIFMYIILAMNYESLIHPLTILLSLPLTVPFALLSLYLTNGTLNLYSALGILVLFGVVKKNAILQIDHMNQLRAKGYDRYEAIIQGNRDRLRPILMTTLALVAGMLPLAVGSGPGAEERRAVAIVVIGGQSLALLLTLLVTPVAYSYFDDFGGMFRRRATVPNESASQRQPLAPVPQPEPAIAISRTQGMAPEAGS
jgi:HAE1 family hydrophobic/amphiphilic exporter-1